MRAMIPEEEEGNSLQNIYKSLMTVETMNEEITEYILTIVDM